MKPLFYLFLTAKLLFLAACNQSAPNTFTPDINTSCIAPSKAFEQSPLIIEPAFPFLSFHRPVSMIQAPEENDFWYLLELEGKIIRFANDETSEEKETILDIEDKVLSQIGESGLLGMVFHPNYADNGYLYLLYTSEYELENYEVCGSTFCQTRITISRFEREVGSHQINPDSEEIIFSIVSPTAVHHAGTMHFGNDGFLYISLGDGGEEDLAQNLNSYRGSLLRIDVDSPLPYGIPEDNPFFGQAGLEEIYAYGFRNPWKWSFDKSTGDIWVGDVGGALWDEVSKVVAGGNHGWPIYEGFSCSQESCPTEGFVMPQNAYPHDEGCAVTGGYVYRGSAIPALEGVYLYGDFCTGNIWGLFPEDFDNYQVKLLNQSGLLISSFAQDHNGEVYLLHLNAGTEQSIYKIAEYQDNTDSKLPNTLSQTGCFHNDSDTIPVGSAIPYDVNMPLWSDGAKKQRWVALPEKTKINILPSGDWIFPNGSVFIKNFIIEDKVIETRLLMKHDDGLWGGYSYEWDEISQTATLVNSSGKSKILPNGQSWWYPSRNQCFRCHTNGANFSLGLESAQMNRLFEYQPGYFENQINLFQRLQKINQNQAFSNNNFPESFPQKENVNLSDEIEVRKAARAYLHTNCSMCHRPQGTVPSNMDFRAELDLFDTNTCNTAPTFFDFEDENIKILDPGNPDNSIIAIRMKSKIYTKMPPIGREEVDSIGLDIIENWINNIQSCN